jgi:sulfur carrier protein ThiS
MIVQLKLWGNLRRFAPQGVASLEIDVPDDGTVDDVVRRLGAGHEVFAAAVNGKVAGLSTRLAPNDRVFLFDHLLGG